MRKRYGTIMIPLALWGWAFVAWRASPRNVPGYVIPAAIGCVAALFVALYLSTDEWS